MRQVFADSAWWPAVVIMVLVIIVVMWPAMRPVTPGAARLRRGRQAALASAARAGLDAALIILGVLALWELRRYSAAPRLSGNGLGIDPVLAVAPALALAGIALLPLRALPAAARLLDRLSARSRRLAAALAGWQVSRQAVREGTAVLLVVLAVATGTLVLAQHQSWRQSQLDQAAFDTGADVRVGLATPLPLGRGAALAHAPGVHSAMPVSSTSSGFDVVALDATKAAGVVQLRPDLSALPAAALWKRITPGHALPGLALPGRPARLDISARLTPPRGARLGPMSASLSVQDGWGIVYVVPAGRLPADGRYHHLVTNLAATGQARYPLRLLGLSLSYQMPGLPPPAFLGPGATATLAIRALAVSPHASGGFPAPFARDGAIAALSATAASPDLALPGAEGKRPAVIGWRVSGGAAALTFTVGAGNLLQPKATAPVPISGQLTLTAGQPPLPVPAIATRAFLRASGDAHRRHRAAAGRQRHRSRAAGGRGPCLPHRRRRRGRGDRGPGLAPGALLAQSQPPLPVTQWWLAAPHGVPAGLPAGAAVVTRTGSAAGLLSDPLPNVPQLSLLVIVAAAALLAGIGFVVSVAAAVRERRLQDALLAALGVDRTARTGQLCLEQLMLSVPAAAAGAAIGVALACLLVPAVTLTTGAAAPFPPVQVVIPLGWTALLALSIAAVPVLAAAATAAYRPDPAAELRAGESA